MIGLLLVQAIEAEAVGLLPQDAKQPGGRETGGVDTQAGYLMYRKPPSLGSRRSLQ